MINTPPGDVSSGVFYGNFTVNASNSGDLTLYRDFMEANVMNTAYNGHFKNDYQMDETTSSKILFLPKKNRLFVFLALLSHGVEEMIGLAINMSNRSKLKKLKYQQLLLNK